MMDAMRSDGLRQKFCVVPLRKTGAFGIALGLLAFGAAMATAQGADTKAAPANDYHTNPKFMAAVKEAQEQERHRQPAFAGDAYRKANKISGGVCAECVAGLYKMQMMDGSYKDAADTARALEVMGTTPMVKSVAAYDRGRALEGKAGEKPKPEQLEEQRAAFQEAAEFYPQNMAAVFEGGAVLARMGRMDDARKEFELCLANMKPGDMARLRVQHFAEDPELATHKMAPAFEVTSLDGARFNLDAMGGRVVLVDFWATWCGPCNAELPEMKKIAKEFAGEPFVMISVSADKDEAVWKDFVAKHEMTWVQYRDTDHKLADAFGVSSIPHYFTIDADGVLTSEKMGEGTDVEYTLKKLIAKAQQGKHRVGQVHSGTAGLDGAEASGK
jgi:thiol-disulfide isomerase/thioredoxin